MEIVYKRYRKIWVLLTLLLFSAILIDLMLGSFTISVKDVFQSLFNYNSDSPIAATVRVFRFPRVITAILVGAALSVSGLLMQTLFQNPLAGPYVLGINSGASLFVAIFTMSTFQFFNSNAGLISAAMIAAIGTGLLILLSSLYVKSKISLLLVGIMLGSFAGALVNVVQSYADPNNLKKFMLWSFGSLQNVEMYQLGLLGLVVLLGICLSFLLIKPLNLLLLGDKSAHLLGVNVKTIRFLIVLAASVLAGSVTAFCGPIAFVGIIIPNIIKIIFKTINHAHLMLGSVLCGALFMVVCDIAMQLCSPFLNLPLNAITSLVGAPVVIWIIMRKF